jgi:hypothetical protein
MPGYPLCKRFILIIRNEISWRSFKMTHQCWFRPGTHVPGAPPSPLSLYSSHTRQETGVEEDEQCTDTRIGDERPGCHTACMLAIWLIKWTRLNLEHKDYTSICRPRQYNTYATTLRRGRCPCTHVPGDPATSRLWATNSTQEAVSILIR